ncbi:uncharacterized protein LOC130774624 [Actinidia eriantha]|uniref:uncharacterized protein LOC130774624 n=1 Tax=Actinidia eriantha TaxID=165200 RepID=UPI002588BCAC|nr:uncharacterized protein LOC130774624 [Actinidia eriantha]
MGLRRCNCSAHSIRTHFEPPNHHRSGLQSHQVVCNTLKTQKTLKTRTLCNQLQVPGSVGTQPASQISSLIQLQQRYPIHLEETPKVPVCSSNYLKPVTSPAGQPSLISTSDTAGIQKPQSVVSLFAVFLN